MIPRQIAEELARSAREYPVVTITGPRQSGKTTLVKSQFPDHAYVNLEDLSCRRLATEDAAAFFRQFPAPVVVDEIQRVPELLSAIQVQVDQGAPPGSYILTGSQQLDLHAAVSQTLAGRTALLQLLPLSIRELQLAGQVLDRDEAIFRGFMPRLYQEPPMRPEALYRDYLQTYVERDVRRLVNIRHLASFDAFLRLLAGRIGQEVNLHGLAGDVGVSSLTLKEWLSVLEASFVVFRLQPYFENFGKRSIKASKIYFTEVGLAAHLLELRAADQVGRDPLLGHLFENLVVMEIVKACLNAGERPDLYFYRDQTGTEVDLLLSRNRKLIPVEIKAGMTYHREFTRGMVQFRKTTPKAEAGYVVYAGDLTPEVAGDRFMNFRDAWTIAGRDAANRKRN